MALSYLLTRTAAPQCFFRGPALKTSKNILIRYSAVLCNKDPPQNFISERIKKEFLQSGAKLALLPSSFQRRDGYSSGVQEEAPHKKHNHILIWQFERVVAINLALLIPLAMVFPSQPLDIAVALLVVMHTHWGLEAIIVDYVRPILFGELAPKVCLMLLYVFSIAMLAGLINVTINDCGLANAIIHFWKA